MVFVPESIWPKVEVSNFYLYYTAHTQGTHTPGTHTRCSCRNMRNCSIFFCCCCFCCWSNWTFICLLHCMAPTFCGRLSQSQCSPSLPSSVCLSPLCFLPFKLRNWELCKAKEEKLHRKPKLFIVPRIASSSPLPLPLFLFHSLFCLYLYWALSRIQAECRIVALSGHLAFQ